MLIGSKNRKKYLHVVSKVHSFVLPPPNEPTLGIDNTSPICSPSKILDARAAFAPRVANAKLFVSSGEWGVGRYEMPVSNTNHNKFGTSSQSSQREQNVLLARSKRARFHAMPVSNQCTGEGPQWSGRIFENERPRFVGVPGKWYDAHLQNMQQMKQQNQNSGECQCQ